jgi:hypothetical protein
MVWQKRPPAAPDIVEPMAGSADSAMGLRPHSHAHAVLYQQQMTRLCVERDQEISSDRSDRFLNR